MSKPLGVQQYFGQDESYPDVTPENDSPPNGAKKTLCIIHEQGKRLPGIALRRRQRRASVATHRHLYVNGNDMPPVDATITAKLQQDPASTTSSRSTPRIA